MIVYWALMPLPPAEVALLIRHASHLPIPARDTAPYLRSLFSLPSFRRSIPVIARPLSPPCCRWTNSLFKSTLHRVVNATGRERYSIAYFFQPSFDAVIECLPHCCSADRWEAGQEGRRHPLPPTNAMCAGPTVAPLPSPPCGPGRPSSPPPPRGSTCWTSTQPRTRDMQAGGDRRRGRASKEAAGGGQVRRLSGPMTAGGVSLRYAGIRRGIMSGISWQAWRIRRQRVTAGLARR